MVSKVTRFSLSTHTHIYRLYIAYFKNTDYLLVKTALLFSLENFQNCVVSRGRLGSQPPLSHRVTPENLALAVGQGTSLTFSRVYWRDTVFLRSYFLHRYFLFITIFSILTFTQMILTLSQTFYTSAVLLQVCKVRLRYERWIQQQKPPSTNMAANEPKQRKLRKCTNCTSRMPSFLYDNHTLCTKCRNQVCNKNLICYRCHDWIIMKLKTFVHYNNRLRIKR